MDRQPDEIGIWFFATSNALVTSGKWSCYEV
jgi:hypothetical protein